MPSYKKTSKYTPAQTSEMTVRALDVLNNSAQALTIEEICAGDMALQGQTTQKMARVLNHLVEGGFVRKTKSKAKGNKNIYMAVSQIEEQGFDIDHFVC